MTLLGEYLDTPMGQEHMKEIIMNIIQEDPVSFHNGVAMADPK